MGIKKTLHIISTQIIEKSIPLCRLCFIHFLPLLTLFLNTMYNNIGWSDSSIFCIQYFVYNIWLYSWLHTQLYNQMPPNNQENDNKESRKHLPLWYIFSDDHELILSPHKALNSVWDDRNTQVWAKAPILWQFVLQPIVDIMYEEY